MNRAVAILVTALIVAAGAAQAEDFHVKDGAEFTSAVRLAKPGDRILAATGVYRGFYHFSGIHGRNGREIVIAAADSARPPEFSDGLQFSKVSFLEIRDLVIKGARGNGLNLDDGGIYEAPSHHITVRGLRLIDLGAGGNQDAIKLSGIDDFLVKGCMVEHWSAGGSGIDMVGCHRGRIEACSFRRGGDSGVQAKGGCADITVSECRFEDFGARGVNVGGSTGLAFFRPPAASMPPNGKYEAKNITIARCVFVGGQAPVAFVGVDGAVVRRCTIYRPGRWAFRILQETRDAGFVPSRGGIIEDSIILFRSDQWAEGGVNVGPGVAAESFRFARNVWFCEDRPERSRPSLPVSESGGLYGQDPMLAYPDAGDFTLKPGSPARGRGADLAS